MPPREKSPALGLPNFRPASEATVHTARYLCAQHSPLRRTGSLSTGAEGVLKVGVEDSTGLRPYSKYQYAAAQTTEYSSRAQHRPRRGLKVRVGLSTGHRFCTATRIAPADARSCTNIALRRLQGVVQPAHLQHSGCRSRDMLLSRPHASGFPE